MIKLTGPWTRDRNAYDPGARVRAVQVDGVHFTVRNLMGPGWPMTIQAASGHHIHMAAWEDWTEVEHKAQAYLADQF